MKSYPEVVWIVPADLCLVPRVYDPYFDSVFVVFDIDLDFCTIATDVENDRAFGHVSVVDLGLDVAMKLL